MRVHIVCMLSHVWLFAIPWTVACQSLSVHQIFQTRILEWVAISFSRGSSQTRDQTQAPCVSCIDRQVRLPWWFSWSRVCPSCGRPRFDPWACKICWRREWLPTPVFLPGEFHGQRSLVNYSRGHNELDTTEWLATELYGLNLAYSRV